MTSSDKFGWLHDSGRSTIRTTQFLQNSSSAGGGGRELSALLTDGQVAQKILAHLGLDTEPPRLAAARALPVLDFAG